MARKPEKNPYLRQIVEAIEDPGGPGWDVRLNCGHVIWCAVRPIKLVYCAECLAQELDREKKRTP